MSIRPNTQSWDQCIPIANPTLMIKKMVPADVYIFQTDWNYKSTMIFNQVIKLTNYLSNKIEVL